jgi:hypothetical protein
MTSREILASQRILKPAVSTVASSVERTGIEPVTSGLQTRSSVTRTGWPFSLAQISA